jgi:uncharacterized protein (DUF2236 family)
LLPPRVREHFELPFGAREEKAVERTLRLMRALYPRLPRTIRFVGPYNEVVNRLRGSKPGLGVRLSNRLWVGQPTLLVVPR